MNNIKTRNLATPIIAQITKDVYFNKRLIIPKGVELHGTVGGRRDGNRIGASTQWTIVYNNTKFGKDNGKTMALSALVLNKAESDVSPFTEDMEAGLEGQLVEVDPDVVKKTIILSGVRAGLETLKEEETNQVTGETRNSNNGKNAAIDAFSKPIEDLLQRRLSQLGADPYFVKVQRGTAFYLYTTQPLDLGKAKRGVSNR